MSEKRTWDESRSPQWRYLLSKDSKSKRNADKRREQAERELSKGISKRKEKKHDTPQAQRTKAGKEILYSASPGGNNDRFHDPAFVSRKKTTKIFENETTTTTE